MQLRLLLFIVVQYEYQRFLQGVCFGAILFRLQLTIILLLPTSKHSKMGLRGHNDQKQGNLTLIQEELCIAAPQRINKIQRYDSL